MINRIFCPTCIAYTVPDEVHGKLTCHACHQVIPYDLVGENQDRSMNSA